jgi:hypothetical protein
MTETSDKNDVTNAKTGDPAKAPLSKGAAILGKIMLTFFTLLILFVFFEIALKKKNSTFSIDTDPNYDRQERNYYPQEKRMNPWVKEGETPYKVAVVGDSFTNGAGVPYQDKYAIRLETLLNLNDDVRPAAIKLWAKGGTSTYDHYRYLEHVVEWEPDAVVLGICLNDAEDHQKNKTHSAWRAASAPQPPKGFMKWLTSWSNVASFVYTKKEVVRAMKAHEEYYQLLYQDDYHGYQKFEGYLGEIKKELDKRDIKFFVMIWPLLGDLNRETYAYHNIHEKVHAVLEGHQIPYVDLLPHFIGKNSTRLQAIPYIDGHPCEIGQRMASEVLYRSLLEHEIIPPEYAAKTSSGKVSGSYARFYEMMNPTTFKTLEEKEAEAKAKQENEETTK